MPPAGGYAASSRTDMLSKGARSWTTEEGRQELEALFKVQPFPEKSVYEDLAKRFGVTVKQVAQWFTNRRYKERTQQQMLADVDDDDYDVIDDEEVDDEPFEEMRAAAAAAPKPPVNVPAGALRVRISGAADLLAVEHPCHVINTAKGVRMLGGTLAVARASVRQSDAIECSLRPEDPLAHPLFGVRVATPGVLLKVTRRKRPQGDAAGSSSTPSSGHELSVELIGRVSSSYRFNGLADYQYVSHPEVIAALDSSPRGDGKVFDVLNTLKPLAGHAMRIPPAIFSMYDKPLEYVPRSSLPPLAGPFTSDALHATASEQAALQSNASHLALKRHGGGAPGVKEATPRRKRAKRGAAKPMHFGERVEFEGGEVPSKPPPKVLATIDDEDELYVAMKTMFEERPVWSRQALRASLSAKLYVSDERLRFRLPQLAYYFAQGPWRMCWIAFGYDPRAHQDAKIYQVLDMRLPASVEHLVPKKSEKRHIGAPNRIRELDPRYKNWATTAAAAAAAGGGGGGGSSSSTALVACGVGEASSSAEAVNEVEGVPDDEALPTQRHVYFQMCDFKGEAVVQLVHEDDNNNHQQVSASSDACHKQYGWYSGAKMDRLRRLVKQSMMDLARQAEGGRPGRPRLLPPAERAAPPSSSSSRKRKTPPSSKGSRPSSKGKGKKAVRFAVEPEEEEDEEDELPPAERAAVEEAKAEEEAARAAAASGSGNDGPPPVVDVDSFGLFDEDEDMEEGVYEEDDGEEEEEEEEESGEDDEDDDEEEGEDADLYSDTSSEIDSALNEEVEEAEDDDDDVDDEVEGALH